MRLLALPLALGLCAGCSMTEYNYKARLMQALDAHTESRRWNGSDGLEKIRDGRRVTDAQVRNVRFNAEKDVATVQVELEGYTMPQMRLERWAVEQEWKDNGDDWVLVKEKEAPLAAAPALTPMRARR